MNILLTDTCGLNDRTHVEQSQEQVNSVLLEYCSTFYPDTKDKFGQLLVRLPEIRLISMRGEEYLYYRHLNGDVTEQSLLMEMLHAKRKWTRRSFVYSEWDLNKIMLIEKKTMVSWLPWSLINFLLIFLLFFCSEYGGFSKGYTKNVMTFFSYFVFFSEIRSELRFNASSHTLLSMYRAT